LVKFSHVLMQFLLLTHFNKMDTLEIEIVTTAMPVRTNSHNFLLRPTTNVIPNSNFFISDH